MTLFLDHQQRLNLIALYGAQRGTVSEMRQFWTVQDRLTLSAAEEEAIGYQVIAENGMEIPRWDAGRKLAPRSFEFSEAEAQRLKKLIDEWPHFQTGGDRRWLANLLEQLETQPTPNGQPALR